jgi:hypothetical protein
LNEEQAQMLDLMLSIMFSGMPARITKADLDEMMKFLNPKKEEEVYEKSDDKSTNGGEN